MEEEAAEVESLRVRRRRRGERLQVGADGGGDVLVQKGRRCRAGFGRGEKG